MTMTETHTPAFSYHEDEFFRMRLKQRFFRHDPLHDNFTEQEWLALEKDPGMRLFMVKHPSYHNHVLTHFYPQLRSRLKPVPSPGTGNLQEDQGQNEDRGLWDLRIEACTNMIKNEVERKRRRAEDEVNLYLYNFLRGNTVGKDSIKRAIIYTLKKEQPGSMTVKEIAKSLRLKPCSVSGWIYNNLDFTPELTRTKRGAYAYCPEPETVPTQQPASAATRETPAALPSQSQGKR